MEDPAVPLERNLYGHPLAGLLWERQIENVLMEHGWEKIQNWECLFVHRQKGLFLSVYLDDIKLAGKKQNIDPIWKLLSKEVDLEEPTSFVDHVHFGCTQRQCEISKDIVDNYRTMFESRISAGGVEKLPLPQNLSISSWSYDIHAKKCVERYCELANKTTQQLYKVSTPCIDDHHFKEEETKYVGELSQVCSQIVRKYFCRLRCKEYISHTESEIISLDAGLRLDGIPALALWDLIVFGLGNTIQTPDRSGQPVVNGDKDHGLNKRSQGMINVLNNIDCVPSNVQVSHQEALLYMFEDNEAVIKMIMKGRSPTLRHVSRTHRVALDCLFDRINLDSKIQIKYIDTKNQFADILTKGNFTRDEWNHLLTLFNISHFSSTACIAAMAKRAQQESGEGRVTAKSRPMMNLTAWMPSVVSSSTSSNPERTSYGCQDPGKSVASDDRSGKPEKPSPPGYSKRIMVNLGLLKSGKVELWSTIDQGNLRKLLGINCKKLPLIVRNLFSAGMRILQGTES